MSRNLIGLGAVSLESRRQTSSKRHKAVTEQRTTCVPANMVNAGHSLVIDRLSTPPLSSFIQLSNVLLQFAQLVNLQ